MERFFVYAVGNSRCTTLYVGVTSNPERRILEHRQGIVPGFTSKYRLTKLIYLEGFQTAEEAIRQEKRLKHWNRAWKIELFRAHNPNLADLAPNLGDPRSSRG